MANRTMASQPSLDFTAGRSDNLLDLTALVLTDATHCRVTHQRGDIASAGSETKRPSLLKLEGENGDSVTIAAATLRHAYPRDIREAVWTLDEYRLSGAEAVPLIAAESFSPGAKELLRKRGIAYFERSGTLYLRWKTWLIDIERPAARPPRSGNSPALFTDAREMVVHALLKHQHEWLTGAELSEISATSAYTCSVVLKELERREWCEAKGGAQTRRRRLVKPHLLLDEWSQHWIQRKEIRSHWFYLPDGSVPLIAQVGTLIEHAGITMPWALTGAAPVNAITPLLTAVDTVELAVAPGYADALAKALKAKPAQKGANVTIVERSGAGMQFTEYDSISHAYVSSPFVMYMDLLDGRGRNKELAQAFREKLMET